MKYEKSSNDDERENYVLQNVPASMNRVKLQFSRALSYKSIRSNEKYHKPLRIAFRFWGQHHSKIEPEILLQFPVKELNDTIDHTDFHLCLCFMKYCLTSN